MVKASEGEKVFLSREQILKADDMVTQEVFVPEWNGYVLVKRLSGEERDQYESSLFQQDGKKVKLSMLNVKARLAAYSIVDANGNRVFSEADIVALGRKSAKALNRIADVCRELSGISDADMEDLTKNSEATASADSHSA